MERHNNYGDAIILMAEGEKEVMTTLLFIHDFRTLLSLDDMNMRGSQILCAWQFCGKDKAIFKNMVNERNKDMVSYVNENSCSKETAVQGGGSNRSKQNIVSPFMRSSQIDKIMMNLLNDLEIAKTIEFFDTRVQTIQKMGGTLPANLKELRKTCLQRGIIKKKLNNL